MPLTTSARQLVRYTGAIATCLLCLAAQAQDSGWHFTFENDSFTDSDRYYTDGWQLSKRYVVLDEAKQMPWFAEWLCDRKALKLPCNNSIKLKAVSAGQLMYTPENIVTAAPQPDDRPFGGWFYFQEQVDFVESDERSTSIGVDFGIIGPYSGAEATQKFIHNDLGRSSKRPGGWDNQIKTELGLLLRYRHDRNFLPPRKDGTFRMADVIGHYGAHLGNVFTNAHVGITGRIGVLGKPFRHGIEPTKRIEYMRQKEEGVQLLDSTKGSEIDRKAPLRCLGMFRECYLWAQLEGRVVARNIFLDGNTFRDSMSVDKKSFVYDRLIGLHIELTNKAFVAFSVVKRSVEFEGGRQQSYGSVVFGRDL